MPLDQDLTEFTTASQAVVSYNYTDIADGTGVQIFFANASKNNTGNIYFLNQTQDDTSRITLNTLNGTNTNFDLTPFNLPRRVTGTAYILATIYNNSGTTTFTFQINKYDGTTETTIGTAVSEGVTVGISPRTVLLPVVLTDTNFEQGDILRLSIKANSVNGNIDIKASNPFRLSIPFNLDI